jgi:hypothetical protein
MLSAHELFGFMSPALAGDIVAFTHETDKPMYRATLSAVAEARKVRPIFLERRPRTEQHATMLATLTRPSMEPAAASLVRAWLLKKHKDMLTAFLDSLAIPHKDGVVEDLPKSMEDEKLRAAVEKLLTAHPHESVAVYLLAFNELNEANWPNLKTMLETDPRLQLGAKG